MDPHSFSKLDPHSFPKLDPNPAPHSLKKLDPNPHYLLGMVAILGGEPPAIR
jgi:hypothetical protein